MRNLVARTTLVSAALVASAAHVPVIAPHLDEAPYMGALFVAFSVTCLVIAGAAVVRPGRGVWAAAAAVCGSAVATYAATRLVAFPQLADDVGAWFEPLGVVSVLSESAVVVAALVLWRAQRPSLPLQARA
jgi:hypothetical protein